MGAVVPMKEPWWLQRRCIRWGSFLVKGSVNSRKMLAAAR